ncbi:MAG: NAD(P)/FAD-dependent oxidoreductase [Bacteroidota bacterium]
MKIGIVGGGFMGLVLAHKISNANAQVTVFEQDSQLGGLSTHQDYGDFIWDRFYHVILPTDNHLIRLIEALDLGESLCWRRSLTGYYVQKKFYSISSSKEFLLFPPLNLWDKFMLGYTLFFGSRITNWKKLEKISSKDWLIRMGGKKTFEKFWRPLLLAKLGENHEKVSAVFIWTYIKRLFEARSSTAQKEHMGYVRGGYKTVFDQLKKTLSEKGSKVLLDCTIKHISPGPSRGILLAHGNKTEHFDKVIFTAPLGALNAVAAPELFEISNKGQNVEYLGVICLVLITKKPISPYYVLNLADREVPFTGVIGMSSLVDLDQTAGYHITYFPKYVTSNHAFWAKSDEALQNIFMDGVKNLYPEFAESDIVSARIHKASKVQPLQVLNYSQIIPRIRTKHPDFYVLNTSQFVNDTLNNNSVAKHIDSFYADFKKELNIP